MKAIIKIDGQRHEVESGRNLLEVCLEAGYDLPFFCWHHALGAIGACRQCAVRIFKDASDQRGRIAMACMTAVQDGLSVSIADPEATAFRKSIVEWLMINHPHDCPVCDEGGECHLQDMTVITGHVHRRTRFPKRTFENQDLGPFVHHEMNRCIHCYRCVRFYADLAGGRDLQPFGSRNRVWFGRFEPGKLESPFSGNLVEVCPTGVFTDKMLRRHYTRKWDLASAPSICPHCALGCNTYLCERYGVVRRVLNRYHGALNGFFLCDRGRFGYGFHNAPGRVRTARRRTDGGLQPLAPDEALAEAQAMLQDGAVGVGSPRAGLEANYLLRRLVGRERFSSGLAPGESRLAALALEILRSHPARPPTLREVERADAIVVLGEDLLATAPLVGLALRQAVREAPLRRVDAAHIPRWDDAAARLIAGDLRGPLVVLSPFATGLDPLASETVRAAPSDLARLAWAAAREIHPGAPEVPDAHLCASAAELAKTLLSAERPLVATGLSQGSLEILRAAADLAAALFAAGKDIRLLVAPAEANTLGAALLSDAGLDRLDRFGQAKTLVVLENDLFRRAPDAERLLGHFERVLVLDHSLTETGLRANLILPTGSAAEATHTLVNYEGRLQRSFAVCPPGDDALPALRWLQKLGSALGRTDIAEFKTFDSAVRTLADEEPSLARLAEVAPDASLRIQGQRAPRESHRASGRTAVQAHLDVREPPPESDPDSPFAFSMEGHPRPGPSQRTRAWAPGWNSAQAALLTQRPIGGVEDPGVLVFEGSPRSLCFQGGCPPPFEPGEALLLVPRHHLFGSEELSARAEEIAALAPASALALSPADLKARGVRPGESLAIGTAGWSITVPAAEDASLAPGVATLTAGPVLELPAFVEVRRP